MTDNLIDLFFSFRGRIGRQAWWLGMLFIALAAVVGIWLFNDDSFDESANAIPGSLTMAAFLWLALCLFIATALCAKRIADSGGPRWLPYTVAVAGAVVICGWGAGAFLEPFAPSLEGLVFWTLLLLALPALVRCAARPSVDEGR